MIRRPTLNLTNTNDDKYLIARENELLIKCQLRKHDTDSKWVQNWTYQIHLSID